jgi:hypothetical protein
MKKKQMKEEKAAADGPAENCRRESSAELRGGGGYARRQP